MKILITQEYEERKQDKKLSLRSVQKEIDKTNKEIDNLVSSLGTITSAIVQKKVEQKIEESEIISLKLNDKLK
jgi:hypothetical protein